LNALKKERYKLMVRSQILQTIKVLLDTLAKKAKGKKSKVVPFSTLKSLGEWR
jgi:hypothetical protein